MGIASSTWMRPGASNSRQYDLFMLEHLDGMKEVNLEEKPEKERVALQAGAEAIGELWLKELHALFPPKQGDSSEMDEAEQALERFDDFMGKGACRESFNAFGDCMYDQDDHLITRCKAHLPILKKCMDAHMGYYEPILALAKRVEDKTFREIVGPVVEEERRRGRTGAEG